MKLDESCENCKGLEKTCPIALVQLLYDCANDDNPLATNILNALVKDDGTCMILETFKKELELTEDEKNQLKLFEGC